MIIRVDAADPEPLFAQIVASVKRAVAAGEAQPGDRLPSVRDLALELIVNPNTVARAYQVLEAEGVTISRKGAGTAIAPRRAAAPVADRERRLREGLDALLADAVHLGCAADEIRDALESALARVRFPCDTKGDGA